MDWFLTIFRIPQDLSHWFKYGYVSHANQRGLYKLDLANMRYIRSIDLSPYNCVPRTLQFSSLCKSIPSTKLERTFFLLQREISLGINRSDYCPLKFVVS
jgi:hypothetical protein